MTAHKHLKELVRARMEKTGERYASARRQILAAANNKPSTTEAHPHFAGNIAATTALRILLTAAGVRAPHTSEPFTEAMLFGIAGGIGIGVFSFYYEKADMATFYIAGRHCWHDDLEYLSGALSAFGIKPVIRETGGKKAAAQHLGEALADGRPSIAWVDMATLPHRGMPEFYRGGSYHVITVYELDQAQGVARIGDLTDNPISISLADLEAARERIKKQRFRLLSIEGNGKSQPDLRTLVKDGLKRCHQWFLKPTLPQSQNNARLEVLKTWANRLHGSNDPERWERIFRPGPNLWRGLGSVYTFIESYGTGGGLCRPLFADFLEESAAGAKWPALRELADRYRELGLAWSELAETALSLDVTQFRQARALRERLAELRHDGGPAEEARDMWTKLGQLEQEAKEQFPLTGAQCSELLANLKSRVQSLHEGEVAALSEIAKLVE